MASQGLNRRMRRVSAIAAAACLALSACTASAPPSAGSGTPAKTATSSPGAAAMAAPDADITPHAVGTSLQFECQDPIGTGATSGALAGPHAIGVPDVMAISAPAIGAGSIQWGAGATYQGFRFAKVGLVLKSGVPFTLSVPATMRGSMKIGWSNSGYTLADTLTGAGCTSNQPDAGWLVYPGGFWSKAPGCLPLTVTSGQSSETINIPVGKPCP